MPYFSGQGKCYIAARDGSGNPLAFRYLGDVSGVQVSLEVDRVEHTEHTSGERLTDLRLDRAKSASMVLTIDEWSKENVGLALRGTPEQIASGTVTNETAPGSLVVGDIVRTVKPKISSLVVKDSAGSPGTLTVGTHYRVNSADHGSVEFLNLGTFTQPFKFDYSNGAVWNVPMFGLGNVERWFRFEGLNTADSNKPVLVELYKVSFDPQRAFDLISDDISRAELNGSPLYDATKVADTVLKQFGRVVFLD